MLLHFLGPDELFNSSLQFNVWNQHVRSKMGTVERVSLQITSNISPYSLLFLEREREREEQ
jgi:hypothetical protein